MPVDAVIRNIWLPSFEPHDALRLFAYIAAAICRAKYNFVDDEGFYADIPGFRGRWANAGTLETPGKSYSAPYRAWMLIRMDHRLTLPTVGRINLNRNHRRRLPALAAPKARKRRVA